MHDRIESLFEAQLNTVYIVKSIETDDEELVSFLFTLGCYRGEEVTVVTRLAGSVVVAIKDARYNIDNDLARTIKI